MIASMDDIDMKRNDGDSSIRARYTLHFTLLSTREFLSSRGIFRTMRGRMAAPARGGMLAIFASERPPIIRNRGAAPMGISGRRARVKYGDWQLTLLIFAACREIMTPPRDSKFRK